MEALIKLVIAAIFGVICYGMAEKRGRQGIIGAILGFLFGIFAVIGYAIAGDKKE